MATAAQAEAALQWLTAALPAAATVNKRDEPTTEDAICLRRSVMVRLRRVQRLETAATESLARAFVSLCAVIEANPDANSELRRELGSSVRAMPSIVAERLLKAAVGVVASAARKDRASRGLITAVECLLSNCPHVSRVDLSALFFEVRLPRPVNAACVRAIATGVASMPGLTHIDLMSKGDDTILTTLANHCPSLVDLNLALSDVSDLGIAAVCGIEAAGCLKLQRLGLLKCANVTNDGAACALLRLPGLTQLLYERILEALEESVKSVEFKERTYQIRNLDQFGTFYRFEGQSGQDTVNTILQACPQLESLGFYIADDDCEFVERLGNDRVTHLNLEIGEFGRGFHRMMQHFPALNALHLTFRKMSATHLRRISECCPGLSVLSLMGLEIRDTLSLCPEKDTFRKLNCLVIRAVDHDEMEEELEPDADTITPQLLSYLLSNCLDIEDLTIQAQASFFTSSYLQSFLVTNPLRLMRQLRLVINPATTLKADLARQLIHDLPQLSLLALSNWNIPDRELQKIKREIKTNNFDIVIT